jgi:hypothetical protein
MDSLAISTDTEVQVPSVLILKQEKIIQKNVDLPVCRNLPDQKAPTAIIISELSSEVKPSQQQRRQSQADQNRRQ